MDEESLRFISGEFRCGKTEARFRASQCQAELRQLRLLWGVALVCFLLYLPVDWLGGPVPGAMLWGRGMIILAGTAVLVITATQRWQPNRDWVASAGLCVAMAGYGIVLGERGESTGALLLLLVGTYLFSPGRYILQALTGICGSLLAIAMAGDVLSWLDISYLLPANLLALLMLAQLNRSRRRLYRQGQQLAREITRRRRAQRALRRLHNQNLALLHNALPPRVAQRLRRQPDRSPASLVPDCTVLFADLVAFTPLAKELTPTELLRLLNEVFSCFDRLAERHRLEKIKTIGDAYLAMTPPQSVAGGGSTDAALMALELQRATARLARATGLPLRLRIGLHRGPVVAGVIGRKRLAYDIWGDVVNVACRLQAAAPPGGILVSAATRRGCGAALCFGTERRLVLRGCGPVNASLLYPAAESSRSSNAAMSSAECSAQSTVMSAKRS